MGTTIRVLVAEDDPLIRLDLCEGLAEQGYSVVGQAATGEAAVALARRLRPDVVVMDVRMPATDGVTAAAHITNEDLAAVVLVTAFGDADLVARAAAAGVSAYLVKPVTPAQLAPAIEVAIARHAERRQLAGQAATLGRQLDERKVIDRAKGIIAARLGLDEPSSYRWLQRAAMDQRLPLAQVALRIVSDESGEVDRESP